MSSKRISRRNEPQVAGVLLVAPASRQRELVDWLHVQGEGVGYEVRLATPEAVPIECSWDVVVLDGESLFDNRVRRELMRRLGQRPREASVLFVCSRLPHERELADTAAWADDFVYSGWAQAERVRSRVQLVVRMTTKQARQVSAAFDEGRRVAVADMRQHRPGMRGGPRPGRRRPRVSRIRAEHRGDLPGRALARGRVAVRGRETPGSLLR